MTVYADEVFFVNAAVDVLLLKTAVCLTGSGTRPWRLWAGAGLGGLAAVAHWMNSYFSLTGEDAIYESQMIEDKIFDIENDMWEY